MTTPTNDKIRNIAIIAHVDHGKTTLVDAMFRQSGMFRDNEDVDDRLMDNMDLEKERGITIAAKNCSVNWNGIKINILDTPGHADFGGEVERALSMVDGAVLLVDASEGPLPQTRFVLGKTLERGLPVIVCVNKVDRKDARPDEVLNEVYDLFIDMDADEDQLDFPVLYAIGRDGVCGEAPDKLDNDLTRLFDTILETVPGPKADTEAPCQVLVSDLGWSDYLGRLSIGKVAAGKITMNSQLAAIGEDGEATNLKLSKLQVYDGVTLAETDEIVAGDIAILSGIEDIAIGDTICDRNEPKALPRLRVDEPTVSMRFTINTSPLAGREGKIVQSRKIRERLLKETLRNVSIRVEEPEDKDVYMVKGRGELQMAIIIETMRREGFELTVGRPEVIYKKDDNGNLLEPMEKLFVDCEEVYMGVVTEKLSQRKGKMTSLINNGTGRVRLEFSIPARALIGYRDEFLTDTKGTGIMNSLFDGYGPHRGEFPSRHTGSIVSDRSGKGVAYAIFNLEPRGEMFVVPGDDVYEGMIVGEHSRDNDIDVNPCKEKKLTNMRASGKDENVILTPVRPMTLERAIHFIREDELVEITPENIRLRKAILPMQDRHSAYAKKKKATGK